MNEVLFKSGLLLLGNPLRNNKLLLVSWRMSGSEFVKQVIRENFPEYVDKNLWGKSHMILPPLLLNTIKLLKIKIIFVISDPRDCATNIAFNNNGIHSHNNEYSFNAWKNPHSLEYLDETIQIITNLLNFYEKHFKENILVLKYEDAIYNQNKLLEQVSTFLNLDPLKIDDNLKYLSVYYKPTNVFHHYYEQKIYVEHYNKHINFYEKCGYKLEDLTKRIDIVNDIDYNYFLLKNDVNITDKISARIKNIDKI